MILPALFFYLFAGVCVASAVMVIVSRNPVHSVLYLILAFVNASGLFVLMGAEFLGMVLLVAMIGAIVLTLRHKAKVKRQDINVQNARTPELAMAVRKVASGQGLQDAEAAEWVK